MILDIEHRIDICKVCGSEVFDQNMSPCNLEVGHAYCTGKCGVIHPTQVETISVIEHVEDGLE